MYPVVMVGGLIELLELIEADGRRPLSAPEKERTLRFWQQEFREVPTERLRLAVQIFLREKARGRPTIGELWAILSRTKSKQERTKELLEGDRRAEILWAISICQEPYHPWQGNYKHTLEHAERVLRHHGFTSWEEAMEHLHPGWTPPEPRSTETYL